MSMRQDLTIVIPAYNEALRLPGTLESLLQQLSSFREKGLPLAEVIVVDDGSTDGTRDVALQFEGQLPGFSVLRHGKNRGKGAAVRTGCLQAKAPWILIADADMSTPWMEVTKLEQQIGDSAMAMGSRALPDSDIQIRQPWYRQTMGRMFNWLLRQITGLTFRDTQCGFKLLNRSKAAQSLRAMSIARFAWDVELILLLKSHGQHVTEVATRWEHRDESRVHPIYDSINMLWSILKVRLQISFNQKRVKSQKPLASWTPKG